MAVFKRQCPSCNTHDKIITRCKSCYGFICSSCGIGTKCKDCFIKAEQVHEVETYFNLKYAGVTI